jgi:hypothetical protein
MVADRLRRERRSSRASTTKAAKDELDREGRTDDRLRRRSSAPTPPKRRRKAAEEKVAAKDKQELVRLQVAASKGITGDELCSSRQHRAGTREAGGPHRRSQQGTPRVDPGQGATATPKAGRRSSRKHDADSATAASNQPLSPRRIHVRHLGGDDGSTSPRSGHGSSVPTGPSRVRTRRSRSTSQVHRGHALPERVHPVRDGRVSKVTATGLWGPYDSAASDGRQTVGDDAVGILFGSVPVLRPNGAAARRSAPRSSSTGS